VLLLAVTLQSTAALLAAPAARQMGDVVFDNIINVEYIMTVRNHIFGQTLTGDDFIAADISFRNNVDLDDILYIRDIIFGARKSPLWPGMQPTFTGNMEIHGSPPIGVSISYNSMDDMIRDIANGYPNDVMEDIEQIEEIISRNQTSKVGVFRNFIAKRQANNLIIPFYKGEIIELEYRGEEYSSNGVRSDYIWLRPNDDAVYYMSIYYLDHLNAAEIKIINEKGFLQTYKQVTDWQDLNEIIEMKLIKSYKEIEFNLRDRMVKGLECIPYIDNEDDELININFVYDNVHVLIKGYAKTLTPEWLSNLDFRNVLQK